MPPWNPLAPLAELLIRIWRYQLRIFGQLNRLEQAVQQLITKEEHTMAALSDLQAEVARNTEVDISAIALIQGLAAKIQELIDAGADPAALQALVDSLKGSSDALAAAVTANTPAQP